MRKDRFVHSTIVRRQRQNPGTDVAGSQRRVDQESRGRQKTFDLLGSEEKELIWIEDTPRRFKDGYNYFGWHPEKVLAFLDRYMKHAADHKKRVVEASAVAAFCSARGALS